jgi:hypothetical protein
VLPVLHVLE